ncbi:MAG: mechanosensitive ion channel family protein, partial [Lutimonas sp.]
MKKIVILFLFASLFAQSQNKVRVDLRNPNSTLYTHMYFLMPEHYDVKKASKTIKGLPADEAYEKAKKIKQVLDGNGFIIDFSKVPIDPNYIDTVDVALKALDYNKHRYAPFPIRLPEVYIEKTGNSWYYSEETLDKIDDLYKKTFAFDLTRLKKRFPEFFTYAVFGILIWKPIAALLMLITCIILYYLLEPLFFFILKLIQKYLFKDLLNERALKILHELARPIVFLVIVRYLRGTLPVLQLTNWNAFLVTGLRIAETVFWIVILLKLVKVTLNSYYEKEGVERSRLDKQFAPILNKLLE